MSVSSVLFIVSCLAMYKLGAFNEKNPGRIWELTKCAWKWVRQRSV